MAFQLIHTLGGRGTPHTHTRDTEATGTADTRLDTALSILRVSSEMDVQQAVGTGLRGARGPPTSPKAGLGLVPETGAPGPRLPLGDS